MLARFLCVFLGVPFLGICGAVAGTQDQPTSETDPRLRAALEKEPEADTDGDGVLGLEEYRAYRKSKHRPREAPAQDRWKESLPEADHADLAYGDQARSDIIRANEALTFVIEVVSVTPASEGG